MEPQTGTHQSIKYVGWCRCAGGPWATESTDLRGILHSLYSIPQVAILGGMALYYQLFPAWSGDTEGACALSADSACCNLQVLLDDHPDHPAWEQKTCLYLKHVVCCLQLNAGPLLCPFIRYIRHIIFLFVEEFLMPSSFNDHFCLNDHLAPESDWDRRIFPGLSEKMRKSHRLKQFGLFKV